MSSSNQRIRAFQEGTQPVFCCHKSKHAATMITFEGDDRAIQVHLNALATITQFTTDTAVPDGSEPLIPIKVASPEIHSVVLTHSPYFIRAMMMPQDSLEPESIRWFLRKALEIHGQEKDLWMELHNINGVGESGYRKIDDLGKIFGCPEHRKNVVVEFWVKDSLMDESRFTLRKTGDGSNVVVSNGPDSV